MRGGISRSGFPAKFKQLHAFCVAPGDTFVEAMCRGRHRVENRVGEVQARGGAGRGWGTMVQMLLLRLCSVIELYYDT